MIVINSSPAINLGRALGGLELLSDLYGRVVVPFEVMQEIESGTTKDSTALMLRSCAGIEIQPELISLPPMLAKNWIGAKRR